MPYESFGDHARPLSAAQTGSRGEEFAADYLRRNGFLIVERNWRQGRLEVDIIASKGERLHFVEVKTRGDGSWITPEEAFDEAKNRTMLRAVNAYVERYAVECEVQVDLVAVRCDEYGSLDIKYYPDVANIHW